LMFESWLEAQRGEAIPDRPREALAG
jgi:hypothetical protein